MPKRTAHTDVRFTAAEIDNFQTRVEITDSCWLWTGPLSKDGYGTFAFRRDGISTSTGAHRASLMMFKGPIPEGLEVDHLCGVRHCANPDHLEPVTPLENTRRQARVNPETCKHGHPWGGDNLVVYSGGKGRPDRTYCLACTRERARVSMQKRRLREKLEAGRAG